MKRRFFTLLSLLSMVLFAMTCALWARSYWRSEAVTAGYWNYQPHKHYPTYFDAWQFTAFNSHGRWTLHLHRRNCIAGPGRAEKTPGEKGKRISLGPAETWLLESAQSDLNSPRWNVLGIRQASSAYGRTLTIPQAIAAGVLAILPLTYSIRRLRKHGGQGNFCVACGYDLRATPDRCPECGTEVKKPHPK